MNLRLAVLVPVLAASLAAQWNPPAAQWGKSESTDVRVLTFNIDHGVCSTAHKLDGANQWSALVRIIAALQPDVILLQEAGDNVDNGTGTAVDTPAQLEAAIHLLFEGGSDPFNGHAQVTSWVQLYDPGYDLPYVFASASTDGFERNAIASRFPFKDLNGDGKATISDFTMSADAYATAGNGGLRGYGVAELDLPDATYSGDLVIGNSHLKAGNTASDHDQRVAAAQRIAYYIDHLFNGAGTGQPDPFGKIADSPPATSILGPTTPVITGGDMNEDEDTDGSKGPAEWIADAALAGGTDGTDKDESDMTRDAATEWFTGNPDSLGNTKFDDFVWQDSSAMLRRAVIFDSAAIPSGDEPAALDGYPGGFALVSAVASDHRAVFADFELPLVECNIGVDLGSGTPGGGGLVPHFTVCGSLASGGSAGFALQDAAPNAAAAAVAGLAAGNLPFAGGTLVPAPTLIVPGLLTDAGGALAVPGVPGGGGPFDLFVQWIVLDPAATSGKALSNAEKVSWLP